MATTTKEGQDVLKQQAEIVSACLLMLKGLSYKQSEDIIYRLLSEIKQNAKIN